MSEPAVLILRSSRRCTGLERRILGAAAAAQEADFAVQIGVLYRAGPGQPAAHPLVELARARGVRAVQIADASPLSPAPLRAVRDLIRDTAPALIHTHDYRSDLLALPGRRLAGSRARLVATSHGHTAADFKLRLYEALDRRLLRSFDRVVGVSRYQCRLLREWGVAGERIVHIPHGVEPGWQAGVTAAEGRALRQRWRAPEDEFLVGFFGRDSREKGLATLCQAVGLAREAEPRIRLVIAGEGPSARRRASPARAGLPNPALSERPAVFFIGYQEDVRPALLACDLIAIPSEREAFGLVALEALALGRPVLASNVGGLPEIVRDGETGWLAPAGDAPAWAAALLEIASDVAERQSRAERGRADVLERFPACRNSQDMVALYRELA